MKSLEISLLNTFHILGQDGKNINFRSNRILALISFLVCEADCPHSRDKLLALIWPEVAENLARNNLRVALHRIRQALDHSKDRECNFILTTPSTVQFNPESNYWLDTNIFTKTISACQLTQNKLGRLNEDQIVFLEKGLETYKGDFLANIDINSQNFEEWLYAKRETYHQAAIWACKALIKNHICEKRWQKALSIAYRCISFEPWVDEGHRQVMRLLVMTDQTEAALRHFRTFSKNLVKEIGVEPQPDTQRLYDEINNATWNIENLNQRNQRVNFPADFSTFVGRDEELAQINRWLENAHCRLITLVGPGGVGKTRLATQASIHISENPEVDIPNGIFFIPLEDVKSLDGLISSITKILNIQIVPGESLRHVLIKYLKEEKLLLVLDNFEHLLQAKDLITTILHTSPNVKIIITSREQLGLKAEWILSVSGLCFPLENEVETPELFPAVDFFIQNVKRIQPDLRDVLIKEIKSIIRICQLVEGLPLALELSANLVPFLPLSEIAEEIAKGTGIMQSTHQDIPERHRSMKAVFEYSWELLPVEYQNLMENLSLFSGEFNRQAAETIAGASLSGLAILVRKSFLHRSTITGKYHIHPLLKQFAREKLDDRDKLGGELKSDLIRQRYSQYYIGQIIEHKEEINLNNNWQIIKSFQQELPHLRQAWEWVIDQQVFETIDQSTTALATIYYQLGLYTDGFTVIDMAILTLRNYIQQDENPKPTLKRMLGCLLVEATGFRIALYDIERAKKLLEEAWEIGQEIGDFYIQMKSQYLFGSTRYFYREFSESIAHIKKIDEIVNDPTLMITNEDRILTQKMIHYAIGNIALLSGDYNLAENDLIKAVNLFKSSNDHLLQAFSLLSLCKLHLKRFQFDLAKEQIDAVQDIFKNEKYPGGKGHILFVLGEMYTSLGDWERSNKYFDEFNNMSESTNGHLNYPLYYQHLGRILTGQGNLSQAQQYYERSIHAARTLNYRLEEADSIYGLGFIAEKKGDRKKAEKHFQESLKIKKQLDSQVPPIEPLAGLARLRFFEETEENIFESLCHINEILGYMEENPNLEGIVCPSEIYLTCYQVLTAVGDSRAPEILAQGQKCLQEIISNISDEGLRTIFLNNIESNRRIMLFS
ncbi:MAG: tetratricopeptide repeat protein [Anaerolineaceae bacterium]|nr:tetratricopeptide repeat protein [Anaerolineaceae bacterium]